MNQCRALKSQVDGSGILLKGEQKKNADFYDYFRSDFDNRRDIVHGNTAYYSNGVGIFPYPPSFGIWDCKYCQSNFQS